MAVQIFAAKQSAKIDTKNGGTNDHTSTEVYTGSNNLLAVDFNTASASNTFNVITKLGVSAYKTDETPYDEAGYFGAYALGAPFDADIVTWDNRPGTIAYNSQHFDFAAGSTPGYITADDIGKDGPYISGFVRNGAFIALGYSTIQTSRGEHKPYITVTTSDAIATGTLQDFSPYSGYINLSKDNVFTFAFEQKVTEPSISPLKVKEFTLQLRVHGSSAIQSTKVTSWAGDAPNVTVPAGTISGNSIDWRVVATTNANQVLTSDWMTLEAEDVPPEAWPISPKNSVVDASKDQIFLWRHTASTGTDQAKSELQTSTDGQTWTALATVTGSERQWTCPANTLTSTIKYWRVRTFNADGEASEWSEAAQIVVIAAPTTPAIQIKSTGPRPSISWQTSEQEAYQVELDGKLSGGTHYGTEKTWTSPAYLADGSHTVRVRVQNQYGMWSDWGAAALPVTNTPGSAITLSVQASSVANLSWQTSGSYDFYLVYRNGKPIAKLTQTQYTDELSSGSTTYQVRGCYADSSNYGLSTAVTVDVRAEVHQVSDLDTGQTLLLPYSDSQHRQTTRTLSRQVELLQLSGAYYPVAVEVDSGTDALSITTALIDESEIRQLMGLVGKLVCAKTPQGDMVIGYITSLPKQHDGFLNVFNFTVEQIDYDDEVTL